MSCHSTGSPFLGSLSAHPIAPVGNHPLADDLVGTNQPTLPYPTTPPLVPSLDRGPRARAPSTSLSSSNSPSSAVFPSSSSPAACDALALVLLPPSLTDNILPPLPPRPIAFPLVSRSGSDAATASDALSSLGSTASSPPLMFVPARRPPPVMNGLGANMADGSGTIDPATLDPTGEFIFLEFHAPLR